jgi:hypothetical protein
VLLERATLERRFAEFIERGDAALTAAAARPTEPVADEGP